MVLRGRHLLPRRGQHLHGRSVVARAALRVDLDRPRAALHPAGDRPMTGQILDEAAIQQLAATPASEYVIEARDVWKRYGSNEVLLGISLGVRRGDVKAILGPSGSGKSTLLRCLGLLEPIDRGEIHLEGARVGVRQARGRFVPLPERLLAGQRTDIGMVFQRFNLFPHRTALGNVTIGLTEV